MSEPPQHRPSHQRWIKRPPRPSRAGPPKPEIRIRPGWPQFLLAAGFGLSAGILGAVLGPKLIDRPGMAGMFGGLFFALAFGVLWAALGGTRQDLKDLLFKG